MKGMLNKLRNGGEGMWHLDIVTSTLKRSLLTMEAGASVLWNRSINLHNMGCKWMVSDGDSKAFNTVKHAYDDCEVITLDCIGYVQKRMGTHLINLKARTRGKLEDGKP